MHMIEPRFLTELKKFNYMQQLLIGQALQLPICFWKNKMTIDFHTNINRLWLGCCLKNLRKIDKAIDCSMIILENYAN